jgi:Protein of unknown function (DUF3306)
MNDPDNFLSRWARRKREAGEGKEKEKEKEKEEERAGEARGGSAPENEPARPDPAPDVPGPKFDVESLPPIEAISAETDITAFMRAGVPETLKHAALRRAWASDPVIRDFVGLNENFWDAAGPDGIAGFGDLDPNLDVRRMVSELFGEVPRQDVPSESGADRVADSSIPPNEDAPEAANPQQVALAPAANVPQRNENAAVQTESSESAPEKKNPRRHGGAIPK